MFFLITEFLYNAGMLDLHMKAGAYLKDVQTHTRRCKVLPPLGMSADIGKGKEPGQDSSGDGLQMWKKALPQPYVLVPVSFCVFHKCWGLTLLCVVQQWTPPPNPSGTSVPTPPSPSGIVPTPPSPSGTSVASQDSQQMDIGSDEIGMLIGLLPSLS